MDQATKRFIASVTQEIVVRFRVRLMRQLYISGTPSARLRMDRVIADHKNCCAVRALKHQELHNGITEWVLAILNYTHNTYYPHLKREA